MTGPRVRLAIESKWGDAWIGAFWRWSGSPRHAAGGLDTDLDIWICLVPCFPIHVSLRWHRRHPYLNWRRP